MVAYSQSVKSLGVSIADSLLIHFDHGIVLISDSCGLWHSNVTLNNLQQERNKSNKYPLFKFK